MNLLVIALVFVEVTALSVKSLYLNLNPFTKDEDLCDKWWRKTSHFQNQNSDMKQCISMIKKKCPDFLTFKTTVTKSYNVEKLSHETWKTLVMATRQGETSSSRTYYKYKNHDLCWDDNGQSSDCEYWWKVAREKTAKNIYKDACITRILKHCENKLSPYNDQVVGVLQYCGKAYDMKEFKYIHGNGETVKFYRLVRQEKTKSDT